MEIQKELLPGAYLLDVRRMADARGTFVKIYNETAFAKTSLPFDFGGVREEYYSSSRRNVIRGMHFQVPPHDHEKIVCCMVGAVLDVLLDLRPGEGYGRAVSTVLSGDKPEILLIPKGVAHGFKSLQDNSIVLYKVTTEYAPQHDCGVRYDSFGFDWGNDAPVVSDRDLTHPKLSDFASPF